MRDASHALIQAIWWPGYVGYLVGLAVGGALVAQAVVGFVVSLVGYVVGSALRFFVDGVIVVGFVVGLVGFVVDLALGLFIDGVIVARAWWLV